MDIQATKLDIMQKLMAVKKEELLVKISNLLDKELVVAYTTDGKPLTVEAYNKRLEKAESQLESGEFLTQEELENESESW